jgi:hypothetical protein
MPATFSWRNRNGLVAHSCLTYATGTAERDAALALVDRTQGYDVAGFIAALALSMNSGPAVLTDSGPPSVR